MSRSDVSKHQQTPNVRVPFEREEDRNSQARHKVRLKPQDSVSPLWFELQPSPVSPHMTKTKPNLLKCTQHGKIKHCIYSVCCVMLLLLAVRGMFDLNCWSNNRKEYYLLLLLPAIKLESQIVTADV